MQKENEEKIKSIIESVIDSINKDGKHNDLEFNIFKVLGIQDKEVLICRLLGELLNPNGSHGLGTAPIEKFLEKVGIKPQGDLSKANVTLEEEIKTASMKRRVDIVIRCDSEIIPIEVKIWAGDQHSQLRDYYQYYFKDNHHRIVYLTPDGHTPSDSSKGDLDINCIKSISFQKEIQEWVEYLEDVNKNAVLTSILGQFREVINKMGEFDAVKKAIGINDIETDIDKAKALITVLNYKDDLMKDIRIKYLKKYLKCAGYSIQDIDADNKCSIDNHALLALVKGNSTVAWICVDQNLYVCTNIKPVNLSQWESEDNQYWWQYIGPKGKKQKYNMRNFTDIEKSEFDISYLLNEDKNE